MEKKTENPVMPNYVREILSIVEGTAAPNKIREQLEDYHENDIADALELMSVSKRQKLYRTIDINTLSDIIEYCEPEKAVQYLSEMDIKKASQVIEKMEPDSSLDLLNLIEKDKRNALIALLDEETKREINLMASFDEDEIGSKMTTNYISVSQGASIKEAMRTLVKEAPTNDNISTVFVVDEDETYIGAIDLRELIIARENTPLDDIIMTSYPYIYGTEEIDDCIERLKDYSEDLIPVLDNSNRLIGVITSQSLIQVVDDEMGEDYARLAGLTAEEDLKEPLIMSIKKRLPWLLVLLALGLVVSSVVGIFESVVSELTIVICFQSLILDMAGNAGTQALAVTIRVLMDENLTVKNKVELVAKEMKVAFSNGFILGLIAVLALSFYISVFKHVALFSAVAVALCIGASLLVAMVISGAVGTVIPLFFKKIHIDPAVASGPLITTINDLVAVVTYYGLSGLILINMLHIKI